MKEEYVETKLSGISIVSKESLKKIDLGKYMEPQEDVIEVTTNELILKLNALMKQVTFLTVQLGRALKQVDWLRGWGAFQFSSTDPVEVEASKNAITVWVRGILAEIDARDGTYHSISFNWVPYAPNIFSLEAYLNPPAEEVKTPGGGGSSMLNPTAPRQPPPPSF